MLRKVGALRGSAHGWFIMTVTLKAALKGSFGCSYAKLIIRRARRALTQGSDGHMLLGNICGMDRRKNGTDFGVIFSPIRFAKDRGAQFLLSFGP
jgi:hypothetical protein